MSCAHPRRGRRDDALTRHQPAVKFLLRLFVFTWVRTQSETKPPGVSTSRCLRVPSTAPLSSPPPPATLSWPVVGGLMGSTPPAVALEEGRCQTFPPGQGELCHLASPESPRAHRAAGPGTGSKEGRAGTATMAGTGTAPAPAGPADGEVAGSGKRGLRSCAWAMAEVSSLATGSLSSSSGFSEVSLLNLLFFLQNFFLQGFFFAKLRTNNKTAAAPPRRTHGAHLTLCGQGSPCPHFGCSSGPLAAEASADAQGIPLNFRAVGGFWSPHSSLPAKSHRCCPAALLHARTTHSAGTHRHRGVNGKAALKVIFFIKKTQTKQGISV